MVVPPHIREKNIAAQSGYPHLQRPAAAGGDVGKGRQHLFFRIQDLLSVKDHLLPLKGQVERGLALKQPHAVFLLQALDVAAQGLLADVEPLRRPGKIHLLRGNQEILDAL